jgi:hypothetical protein
VCTESFSDVTDSASFRSELHGLEVFDIFSVEEEVSDRSSLLVNLERVTGEDYSLGSDSSRVGSEERASSDEVNALIGRSVEVVGRCCWYS